MSRASSPENDFVDVESTDNRPHSSASGTSQKQPTSSGNTAVPESKRSRGRPRKFKENSEEGLFIYFKMVFCFCFSFEWNLIFFFQLFL